MVILALDPSTKNTGWSIFINQDLHAHGYISAGSTNLFNRIHYMIDELKKIIEKYNPEKAILEDPLPEDVKHNIQTFKALTYLQGFICDLLNDNKIEYKFYTSSEWRKKCGIRTGAGIKRDPLKASDIAFVQNQFGIKVNDDEADAICIGFAAVGGEIKKPQIIIDNSGFEFA